MNNWGSGFAKKLLKTIVYSGLNGASLRGGGGSIRAKVKEACDEIGQSDVEGYLQKVLRNPIIMELAMFQTSLGQRDKIYLPSRAEPYYGKVEEEMRRKGGSRYHEGLLSSRALASHEVVLLVYMVDALFRNRLGFPLSLENDGLLLLTRASSRDQTFAILDSFLQSCSQDLLGVKIPLERKL